jgi:hypothetical protein
VTLENKKKEAKLHSDAWERFERAVDVVAKSPTQYRMKRKKKRAITAPIIIPEVASPRVPGVTRLSSENGSDHGRLTK